MEFRLNPFVQQFKKGDIIALFNSLTLDTIYLSSDELIQYAEKPHKTLLDKSIFVPCDFDARDYFYKNTPDINAPSVNVAYFLLTSACNFRCKYCFVETRIEREVETNMTKEIAKKGLELLKRNVKNEPLSIIFYGGEPLLRFNTIKYIVAYTSSLGLEANFVIVTNGSIMNDEIATFLKENNFEVGISVDGVKETHDNMRIDRHGNGTYNSISNTIEVLKSHGIIPGISCTLSRHNMGNPLEIKDLLKRYNLSCVSFNLPAPNGNIVISDNERKLLIKNLMFAETELIHLGILEDKVVDRRLRSFIEKKIWARDCAAYGQQVVIMPNGKVGVCHGLWPDEENSSQKSYFDIDVNYPGLLSNHPIWKEWGVRTTFNIPSCWGCPAISLCGGGCAKNSNIKYGSIWELDKDICLLMNEVIPWIIWTYYDIIKERSRWPSH